MLEECTIEEQRSVVPFCRQKESMQMLSMKEYFQFTVGNIFLEKAVHKWVEKRGNSFADEEFETEVRKWLRQRSKYFYTAGFSALVKRWDKCVNISVGYVEKSIFFQFRISYILLFISIYALFTDSSSYN
jgi:hypothetical protein